MSIDRRAFLALLTAFASAGPAAAAEAWADLDTLSMLTSAGAGSNTNLAAQTFARAARALSPGTSVTVEDQPGASGKLVLKQLNLSGRAGRTIGILNPGAIFRAVLDPADLGPNPAAFGWIGNLWSGRRILIASAQSGLTSFEQLLRSPKPLFVPAPAANSLQFYQAALINTLTGSRLRPVPGFPSPSRALALMSGEVDCILAPMDIMDEVAAAGDIHVLMRLNSGSTPAALAGVPQLSDFAKAGPSDPLMQLIEADSLINRPLAAGPGLTPERLALLRRLFDAVLLDADFQQAILRGGSEVNAMPGAEVQARLEQIMAGRADLSATLQAALACGLARAEGKNCG